MAKGAWRGRALSSLVVLAAHLAAGALLLTAAAPAPDLPRGGATFLFEASARLTASLGVPDGAWRFLAYAYCYHFLNWLSKTETIGWGRQSRARWAWIAAGSAVAWALYAWDFGTGFLLVLPVSVGHAVMEFPLGFKALGLGGFKKGPVVRSARG